MAENYIVSARKYRPQTFDTVVGQEHITTTLKNAIRQQHLAHAYLFCGPRGVGKTTCARILARTINCENPTPDMEACGVCTTCTSFQDNTSFNIFELDAASNNSVDDIRNLTDQVRFAPQQGRYKIYIIDEVHMLSAAAFNAFLKTLEEPPPYAIFILATTEKHKILPTILSRCQIFDFKRITTNDIVGHLQYISGKENMKSDEAALHIIAQKSEGCMRDALSMIDRISSFTNGVLTYSNTMEHLNLLDADYYFSLTDYMLAQDVGGTLLLLDQALEKGFEGDVIINGLSEHMRNLLLCKDQRMAKLLDVPNDHKPIYFEKANYTPPSFILSALNVTNESELSYKSATNKRLHAELCLIRLCYILQATQPGNFSNSFAEGEKKNDGNVVVPPTPQPYIIPAASVPVPANVPQMQPQVPPVAFVPPAQQPQVVNEPARQSYNPPAAVANPAPQQAPVAPQAPVAATVAAPATTAKPNRRISKGFMDDIDDESAGPQEKAPEKILEHSAVQALFEQYKKEMQAAQRLVLYAQLSMMKVETYPPDEIRMVSPHEMTNEYALNHRNEMIDYFRKETGILIRITTEIQLNEEVNNEPGERILTKTEIYEEMAKKNPFLAQLKDKLNLQIEF